MVCSGGNEATLALKPHLVDGWHQCAKQGKAHVLNVSEFGGEVSAGDLFQKTHQVRSERVGVLQIEVEPEGIIHPKLYADAIFGDEAVAGVDDEVRVFGGARVWAKGKPLLGGGQNMLNNAARKFPSSVH